jgi:hypothetical protein
MRKPPAASLRRRCRCHAERAALLDLAVVTRSSVRTVSSPGVHDSIVATSGPGPADENRHRAARGHAGAAGAAARLAVQRRRYRLGHCRRPVAGHPAAACPVAPDGRRCGGPCLGLRACAAHGHRTPCSPSAFDLPVWPRLMDRRRTVAPGAPLLSPPPWLGARMTPAPAPCSANQVFLLGGGVAVQAWSAELPVLNGYARRPARCRVVSP